MSEKILIIDRIEDIHNDKGELSGKRCFDSTGESVAVKNPRGAGLKERWDELQVGLAYSFTMGDYQGNPYVQGFKSVKDEFVKQAQAKVESKTIDTKNRSYALSYAKDLAVAGKIGIDDIGRWSKQFEKYLNGEL